MKKTILTYGLISGTISVLLFLCTFPFMKEMDNSSGMLVGYTGMILAFALIFFGISSFKKNQGNTLTLKQGFKIGLGITIISSACYALMWVIAVQFFIPDFMDNMISSELAKMQNNGATAAEIKKYTSDVKFFKKIYENPVGIFLFTMISEPIPVGIVVTLIASLILKTPKQRQLIPE